MKGNHISNKKCKHVVYCKEKQALTIIQMDINFKQELVNGCNIISKQKTKIYTEALLEELSNVMKM